MHFSQFVVDFLAQDNLLGHVSYILAITSMIMRAMRWLRFFAILASLPIPKDHSFRSPTGWRTFNPSDPSPR